MTYIYQPTRDALLRTIEKNAHYISGDVLDIGCGKFDRYSHLFNYKTLTRIDREGAPVIGNIEAIPSPDNFFDSVICTQVIGDVKDLKKAMGEIYRVLKPGGTLLLTEGFADAMHDLPNDYWRFTGEGLKVLCENAGFLVLQVEKMGGFYSVKAGMNMRYWIDKLNLYQSPFARVFSFLFKLYGKWAFSRDREDNFALGFLAIGQK